MRSPAHSSRIYYIYDSSVITSKLSSENLAHFLSPMAEDPEVQTLEEGRPPLPPHRTPLIAANGVGSTVLDGDLCRLELFLAALGFHHAASLRRLAVSCSAFFLLGAAVPLAEIIVTSCAPGEGCEKYQIERFDICVLVFRASLAAVSLACVSRNLSKYGVRRFLFVDQQHGELERFQREYCRKIQDFFCLLFWWMVPCFFVKAAREVIRFVYIYHDSRWKSIVVFLSSTISWTYSTIIFLSACILFNLVCNLQVIHFEDYGKLLEREEGTLLCLEEHLRLRYYLSKMSHRFRVLLLSVVLLVTASQIVTLFEIAEYSGIVNFTTSGDLIVSSLVQVVGVIICLHAAAKISHRAQGIASVASRWHALLTYSSPDSSHLRVTNSSANLKATPTHTLTMNYSESDLESLDNVTVQTHAQLISHMSSYHKREALVLYLERNPGGITMFGWTIDRAMMNTLFLIELSLITFVLRKTLVFSAS